MSGSSSCLQSDYVCISGSSYQDCASFKFCGTGVQTPSKFSVVMGRTGTSGTVYVRIYDVTNNNEICSLSFTASSKAIYSTTSFANLPAGEAVFELQIRETGSTAKLYSMSLL